MIGGDAVLGFFPPSMSLLLTLFTINLHQSTETPLVNGSEALASLNAISGGLAFELNGYLIILLF